MIKGILITGGSGGIGSALVRTLRGADYEVCFTFRQQEIKARELELETGAKALHYDSSNPESLDVLCGAVAGGELNGLVNLAASRVERRPFLKLDCQSIISAMDGEVLGPLKLSQAFATSCKNRKMPGAIVNVLTSYVLGLPPEKMLGYVMTKHALLGLTRALAVELAKYGIRVNAVSPDMTRTDYISDLPARFIEMAEEGLPLKRLAAPEEVSSVIAFLLTPGAGYVLGANIPITGGISC
jgi:NAD(P)-dependent dehydrogenase (short-subunit alcohol dehydrogenase family)